MGNWKLTRSQEPQALTEPVLREMRRAGPAACRVASSSAAPSARRSALWLLEVAAGTLGLPVAQPGARLRRPDQPRRLSRRSRHSPEMHGPHAQGGCALVLLDRAHLRHPRRSQPGLPERRVARRRGHGHQRAPRCASSARTSAASPTSAPRTSGSSAPATARATTAWASRCRSWARRPRPGPLRAQGRGRPAHRRHQQGHPRARCRSPWASPASSRPSRRRAAYERGQGRARADAA